jgi:hypothetical protein
MKLPSPSALMLLLVACTPTADRRLDSAAAIPDSSPPRPPAWTVTDASAGPIRAGMTLAEAAAAAGGVATDTARLTRQCDYVRFSGTPPGVSVMIVEGRVARVDIDSTGITTDRGAAVGDDEAKVRASYAGRLTSEPHKYVDGVYLLVRPESPADSGSRLLFETDHGRVTRYRVGRLPEVRWVEGCS